jgi:hypothetical protein
MDHESVLPTAEVIEDMAAKLRDGAKALERLAVQMRATQELELAGDAISVITNLVPNLRLDLLVVRPLKATRRGPKPGMTSSNSTGS